MQYILTEQEFNRGYELRESWIEEDIPFCGIYNKSEALNMQGYFTIIECTDEDKQLYRIRVLLKNR